MPWIESHTTLRAHKKLKPLCDKLKVSRAQAIGHLHMLWWWAIDNRENGCLDGLFDRDIAVAADWSGDPEKFRKALVSTGWLTKELEIKDWMEYAGRLLNERRRMRKKRTKPEHEPLHDPGHVGDASATTEPNRTEPNRNTGLLIKKPQEKVIKSLLAARLAHDLDSEANETAYKELVSQIESDPKIKDPVAVAIYRATHGFAR